MVELLQQRADRFDRAIDDRWQIGKTLLYLDCAALNTVNVSELVGQTAQLADLARYHRDRLCPDLVGGARPLQAIQCVAERSERVPQVVRQRRKKLIHRRGVAAAIPFEKTRARVAQFLV